MRDLLVELIELVEAVHSEDCIGTYVRDVQKMNWFDHRDDVLKRAKAALEKEKNMSYKLYEACKKARARFSGQNGQVSKKVWNDNYEAIKALDEAIADYNVGFSAVVAAWSLSSFDD